MGKFYETADGAYTMRKRVDYYLTPWDIFLSSIMTTTKKEIIQAALYYKACDSERDPHPTVDKWSSDEIKETAKQDAEFAFERCLKFFPEVDILFFAHARDEYLNDILTRSNHY